MAEVTRGGLRTVVARSGSRWSSLWGRPGAPRPPFLSRWTPRRVLAVFTLGALGLLIWSRTDPRLRAGILYWRAPAQLVMPVSGLPASQVKSSWHSPRNGGRKHEGIDLFAPRGTGVVAATDGVVWYVGRNTLGGNVVTIVGAGWKVYYYAHLEAWARNLRPGDRVHAGDLLGAVGNTGDAAGLPTHLHFGVYALSVFGTRAIDPTAMLRAARVLPGAMLVDGTDVPPAGAHTGGREDLEMP